MLEITVINCDGEKVQYEWDSKIEFIDAIDSDNENIPMLDDVLTAVDTDDVELHKWWKNTDGITVGDLYEECNCKSKNENSSIYDVDKEEKDMDEERDDR